MKVQGIDLYDVPIMGSALSDDLVLVVQNNRLRLQSYQNLTSTYYPISGDLEIQGIYLPSVPVATSQPTDELVVIVENNGLALKQVGFAPPVMAVGSSLEVEGLGIASVRFSGTIDGDEYVVAIRSNQLCLIPIPASFSSGSLPTSGRTMFASLKSSLILDAGTGGPTWSRATKAWNFNEIGYLQELAIGCAAFGGARLVRNLVPTPSNTLAVSGTKTVTLTQAATLQFSMGAGAGTATFSGTGGATGTLAAGAGRVSVNKTVTSGTFIVTASVAELVDLSIVDVTNYDASYIPEYVSVGVESSPYFGAGIDGAKYFETDWQGAPIPAANLLGLRKESAATNNLLHCRDLSNSAWSTKTSITAAKTAAGLDGIANTATTLTATTADAIILQPITLASAARCASAYVKRRTGTGTISFTQNGGSTWTDITAQINSSTWSRVQITATLADPSVGFKISTSGDEIDVDCAQNEAGAVATSPIVTTTAAVTRNADSLTYQTAGNIDFAVGTVYCSVKTLGVTTIAEVAMSASASALFYRRQGGANTSFSCYDGTNLIDATGLSDVSTGNRKRAMSYGPAGIRVSGDGLAPAAGLFVGNFGSAGSITIGGSAGGGNAINGYIGPVAIYNYQMTDAELQAITS